MSVESHLQKEIDELKDRISRMEEVYPRIYQIMTGLRMATDSSISNGIEVANLMDSIKEQLRKIEEYVKKQ